MFIIKLRFIFIECVIKSNITIQKILGTFCLNINSQEITIGHLNILGQARYLKDNSV